MIKDTCLFQLSLYTFTNFDELSSFLLQSVAQVSKAGMGVFKMSFVFVTWAVGNKDDGVRGMMQLLGLVNLSYFLYAGNLSSAWILEQWCVPQVVSRNTTCAQRIHTANMICFSSTGCLYLKIALALTAENLSL